MITKTLIVGLQGAGKSNKANEIIGKGKSLTIYNTRQLAGFKIPTGINYLLIEESNLLIDQKERHLIQTIASEGKYHYQTASSGKEVTVDIPNIIVVAQCQSEKNIQSSFKEKGWNVIVVQHN